MNSFKSVCLLKPWASQWELYLVALPTVKPGGDKEEDGDSEVLIVRHFPS